MPYEANQMSKKERKALKRQCDWTGCKSRGFLQDWTGYKHCFKHWYKSLRYGSGEGKAWFFIKTTRIK